MPPFSVNHGSDGEQTTDSPNRMKSAMTSTLTYEELLDNPAVKEVTPEELRVGMQIIGNRAILSDAKDNPDLGDRTANGKLRVA